MNKLKLNCLIYYYECLYKKSNTISMYTTIHVHTYVKHAFFLFYRAEDVQDQMRSVSRGHNYLVKLCDSVDLDVLPDSSKFS